MFKYFQIKKDNLHIQDITTFVNEYINTFIENPEGKEVLLNIKEYNDEFMYCDRCGREINEDDAKGTLGGGSQRRGA